jgi:hypothetical protein
LRIKNFKIILILLALIYCACSLSIAEDNWSETKSDHFIVYHSPENEEFAKNVSQRAEDYYKSIADDLGYVRYSNFWKWDKRVKIYIYDDHISYIEATGEQSWSHGIADYFRKKIISYAWGEGFLDSLLPHELAHLIFRDFVGFKSDIPLWLDEGVAQWEEKLFKKQRLVFLRQQSRQNIFLPMKTMFELDIRKVPAEKIIMIEGMATADGNIPQLQMDGKTLVQIYYLQAFSLVGFLMENYGADNFVTFSRQLRDGKPIEDALRFAYPQSIRSIDELEKQWKRYILEI